MKTSINSTWAADRRPGLLRLANALGSLISRCGGKPSLSPASLEAAARRRTGLSRWDQADARQALQCLLDSLETDDDLSFVGRAVTRSYVISLIANRMRVQRDLDEHPEIADEAVPQPLFIVGLPRTGTTLIYNLLAQDNRRRPLLAWEAIWPAPFRRGDRPDHRIREARRLVVALRYGSPNLPTIHPLHHDGPEECTWLMAHTFMSPAFLMAANLTTYESWLWSRSFADRMPACLYYKRLLQRLQWGATPRPWLLKSPSHLFELDALLNMFPDATIVQTHRDPTETIPSGCSLFALTRSFFTDHVDPRELGAKYAKTCSSLSARASACRQENSQRFIDVRFDQLVADPIGTARQIYRDLGRQCSDELVASWQQWLAHNHRHRHGVHRYDLQQFGLDRSMLAELFAEHAEPAVT